MSAKTNFRQQTLPGAHAPVSHANRGRDFERELERLHNEYARLKKGKIERCAVEWTYISERDAAFKAQSPSLRPSLAKTFDGRNLQRVESNVDFAGGYLGRHVAFDAKETAQKSIPLKNFRAHQVDRLVESEKCGNLVGFLIYFSAVDRAFFATAQFVRNCFDKARQPNGRQSISIEILGQAAREIPRSPMGFDWAAVLFPNQKEQSK